MFRLSAILIFLSAALLVDACPAQAQLVDQWGAWENGITEHWWLSSKTFTNEEAARAIEQWQRIGAVNPTQASRWEGDYFAGGETHGTYLRWSRQDGFLIADVDKCQA